MTSPGIDFLRIARGTLIDSKMTIEELYQWEFHGPFLDISPDDVLRRVAVARRN